MDFYSADGWMDVKFKFSERTTMAPGTNPAGNIVLSIV